MFANGPMDVLDHSCSKLGFGGKMCIDGTLKMEEEIDDHYISDMPIPIIEKEFLIKTDIEKLTENNTLKEQILLKISIDFDQ